MLVVSGPVGHQRVHFEAPAAEPLDAEMARFLAWFNGRQRSVINRQLDGFEGNLTSSKYQVLIGYRLARYGRAGSRCCGAETWAERQLPVGDAGLAFMASTSGELTCDDPLVS